MIARSGLFAFCTSRTSSHFSPGQPLPLPRIAAGNWAASGRQFS